MRVNKKKYHYFYKITNNINNHFYYGIHSTNDLNDGYMGSGTRLKCAYKKYGIDVFSKEILMFFDTREQAAEYESEIVNESLIKDINCYNITMGGDKWKMVGTTTVRDKNGLCLRVCIDDPRYLSGEYVGITKGKVTVVDLEGNTFQVSKDDPRYLSGELVHNSTDRVTVVDLEGNTFQVSKDNPRYLSGEYVSINKGKIVVKDTSGNYFYVSTNDERVKTGLLKPIWCGKKHKPETIEKVKTKYKEIGHQQGEKNSQYGTCWITKDNTNKKIKKEDLNFFEQQGWRRGRICKTI